MHQEHNIPRNLLAQDLTFVPDDPERHFNKPPISHITMLRDSGFFARGGRTQAPELNHFARVLRDTVVMFAKTEREKYPEEVDCGRLPDWGHGPEKLFSDETARKYSEFLTRRSQDVRNWITGAKRCAGNQLSYGSEDGDFADAVNYPPGENEMGKILFLARHPKVPLHTLQNLWRGYTGFGFGFVAEGAMDAYIFFNVCSAMDLLRDGLYMRTKRYEAMVGRLNHGMRYSAQQIPHRQFYFPHGYNYQSNAREPHLNLSRLEEHLKQLFRLLYRYELLCRECGVEPQLESEVIRAIHEIVRHQGIAVEQDRHWKAVRFI